MGYDITDYLSGAIPAGGTLYCPFHEDSLPSAQVMADTGKFWCYRCRIGGDKTEIARRLWFDDLPWHVGSAMARQLVAKEHWPALKQRAPQPVVDDSRIVPTINNWVTVCQEELAVDQGAIYELQQGRGLQDPLALGLGLATDRGFTRFIQRSRHDGVDEDLLIRCGIISKVDLAKQKPWQRRFRLHNRFIIPERRDGVAVYYNARSRYQTDRLKYLNPSLPRPIFGMESLARSTSRIWMVEGVFDMLPLLEAGESVIATTGLSQNRQALQEVLDQKRDRILVVAYDNDPASSNQLTGIGQQAGAKWVSTFQEMGHRAVQLIPLGTFKDIGEWATVRGVADIIAYADFFIEE